MLNVLFLVDATTQFQVRGEGDCEWVRICKNVAIAYLYSNSLGEEREEFRKNIFLVVLLKF